MNIFNKILRPVNAISIIVFVSLVQSTPLKLSKPQALTVANLTEPEIKQLIAQNPPQLRPVTYPDNEQISAPLIPLYLPDPERNKFRDDYRPAFDGQDSIPIKLNLSLDPYTLPLNIPADQFSSNVEQAEKEKTSYSYNDRYDYYLPMPVVFDENHKYGAKELQLMELMPPSENNEPNYYAVKPKKIPKKFQRNKKDVNVSKSKASGTDKLVRIDNDGLVRRTVAEDRTMYVTTQPIERFAPAPSFRELTEDDLNTGEYFPNVDAKTEAITLDSTVPTLMIDTATAASAKIDKRKRASDAGELNANNIGRLRNDERVEFQMHGFNGPNSYKFGFDTGIGKNRQFRIEERDDDGSIKGQYGHIDKRGKIHLTKYTFGMEHGFRSERVPT